MAEHGGVNVHVGVVVHGRERAGLERLCRYVTSPPIARGGSRSETTAAWSTRSVSRGATGCGRWWCRGKTSWRGSARGCRRRAFSCRATRGALAQNAKPSAELAVTPKRAFTPDLRSGTRCGARGVEGAAGNDPSGIEVVEVRMRNSWFGCPGRSPPFRVASPPCPAASLRGVRRHARGCAAPSSGPAWVFTS